MSYFDEDDDTEEFLVTLRGMRGPALLARAVDNAYELGDVETVMRALAALSRIGARRTLNRLLEEYVDPDMRKRIRFALRGPRAIEEMPYPRGEDPQPLYEVIR